MEINFYTDISPRILFLQPLHSLAHISHRMASWSRRALDLPGIFWTSGITVSIAEFRKWPVDSKSQRESVIPVRNAASTGIVTSRKPRKSNKGFLRLTFTANASMINITGKISTEAIANRSPSRKSSETLSSLSLEPCCTVSMATNINTATN